MKVKNLVKVFAVAAVMALSLGVLAGCSSDSSSKYNLVESGKLTVASSLDFPPFETLDGDTATGFDIAVIQEIADRLDLECEIKNTKFDTIIPAIASGEQFDVGISGITITPEREDEVAFSDVYYSANQSIVVVKGEYTSVDQLSGKKIAAQSGTTGQDYALENISDQVIAYDEYTACFAALQAGNVEAIAVDLPVAEAMLESYPDFEIIEKVATGDDYGIAVNKDNTELVEAINDILKEMEEDGTLEKLEQEYLSTSAV